MSDYVPRTDQGLLEFVQPYSAQITATPTAFGLSAPIALELSDAVTDFQTKQAAAVNPLTRGPSSIFAKDQSRVNLVKIIRQTAKQIQGTISVTDQQRVDLGLPVRSAPTPIPVPSQPPAIDIKSVSGRTVTIRVHGEDSTKRAKPPGCHSLNLYSFVGEVPPSDPAEWRFEGGSTRVDKLQVVFPNSVPAGSQVWLVAQWLNSKSQAGVASDAVSTTLAGGSAAPMTMKIAA